MKIVLSKELLIKYLGTPNKKTTTELIWQCPCCAELGGDTHKDNLKFNIKKRILYCFADCTHSRSILKDIFRQENQSFSKFKDLPNYNNIINSNYDTETRSKIFTEEIQNQFRTKMLKWNEWLLEDDHWLWRFESERGINKNTVQKLLIGGELYRERWAFPIFKYSTTKKLSETDILGFEYRSANIKIKKITREKGSVSHLAMINEYTDKTEVLVVVEGFCDGYALYQYLDEQNQASYYHIVTCSNGVGSLLNQLEAVNFSEYKKYYLFIDNDCTSRPIAQKIIKKYPQFEDLVAPQGFKDFNDFYKALVRERRII